MPEAELITTNRREGGKQHSVIQCRLLFASLRGFLFLLDSYLLTPDFSENAEIRPDFLLPVLPWDAPPCYPSNSAADISSNLGAQR
jgi:hypothetical protein